MTNDDEKKRQGERDAEDDPDRRKADSAFDDLIIEVDESELKAELESELPAQPPSRKA